MNTDLTQLIVSSLITGFVGIIGAVVGGIFAYKGSINAAKKQTDFLYAQETENRERIEKQQQEVIRQALIAEIKETVDFLTQESIIPLLSTEAWALYKGNIAFLSVSLQEELVKGYAEIKRCNAYFEMNMAPGNTMEGRVHLGHFIDPQKKIVLDTCHSLLDRLSQK